MAEVKTVIFGHTVSHDESVSQGIYFLARQLSIEEAKVFFDEAYNKGHAIFQDHLGFRFKLIHHNDEYQLVKP
jgi:hypothetical protein